jgi:6-phosphogluconolactonase
MILFLVVGEGKAQAVEAVLDGPYAPHKWPAQRIKPDDGLIYWLLDEAAANRIS